VTDQILAEGRHSGSDRWAFVAHELGSVWLYLTAPGTQKIAADCWLFNVGPAPSAETARAESAPPPVPVGELEPGGDRSSLPEEITLLWNADGHAVAACADGQILGFIRPGHSRGTSRYLRSPGPWGDPFDAALCEGLFHYRIGDD
jgi:hypothetical protein